MKKVLLILLLTSVGIFGNDFCDISIYDGVSELEEAKREYEKYTYTDNNTVTPDEGKGILQYHFLKDILDNLGKEDQNVLDSLESDCMFYLGMFD